MIDAKRDTTEDTGAAVEREAARAVLAEFMLDNDMLAMLPDLRPDAMHAFGPERHVLDAIRRIVTRGHRVDMIEVSNELQRVDSLVMVGGLAFVAMLLEYATSSALLEQKITIVNDNALRHGIRRVCQETAVEIGDTPPREMLDVFERRVTELRDRHEKTEIVELVEHVKHAMAGNARTGVATGFRLFDWRLGGGLQVGDLVTVAARPGQGKTSWAACTARHAARNGQRVLFFSLEMVERRIAQRMIALEGVPFETVKNEGGNSQMVRECAAIVSAYPIVLVHRSRPTVLQLRALARRVKPKLIVVDYLQLVRPDQRANSRVQEVDMVTEGLSVMAKEFSVPMLALAQLNRAVEASGKLRRPMLSDLRESGSIEQHSDVVAFIHRPDYYTGGGDTEFVTAKNRDGELGVDHLQFVGAYTRFDNVESGAPRPHGGEE